MTTQGIIIIDLAGLALIALIVNLVRTRKLYVGYAAIWLLSTAGLLLTVSIPALLDAVTEAAGAVFPVSALTLLALIFIIVMLIFFSVKLTTLSEHQTELIQTFALKDLLAREGELNKASKVRGTEATGPTFPEH
jgi:Uncharacterized conserved protein (DUF2304)